MSKSSEKDKRKRDDTFNRECFSDDEASSTSKNIKSRKRMKNQSLSDSETLESESSNKTTDIKNSPEGSETVQEVVEEQELTEMEMACSSAEPVKTDEMEIPETRKMEEVSKHNSPSSPNKRFGIRKDEVSGCSSESSMESSVPTVQENAACKNTSSTASPSQRPRIMVRIDLSLIGRRNIYYPPAEEDISKATDLIRGREFDFNMGVQETTFSPSSEVGEPGSTALQEIGDNVEEELEELILSEKDNDEKENEEKQK